MANETIKVENLIIALNNMERWCKALAQSLEGLGRSTPINVPSDINQIITGKPPVAMGTCLKETIE